MLANEIHEIVVKQRKYFKGGQPLDVSFRIAKLKQLKKAIQANEEIILEALYQDLGKTHEEAYMCEVGMVYSELNYMLSHTKHLAKKQRVQTPLAQFHATSYRVPCPYGVVLVMSPWNYPFLLTMDPLIDAIAAGNTVCIKPSAYSPNTSKVIFDIIQSVFDPEHVNVIQGGRQENQALLNEDFDYIFFTGSLNVGKEVMRKASEYLTPITLELGGKSPCIVDETANISLAAKRIVFGKFLNAGQTCVAPDHLYVHESVKDKLIQEIIKQIEIQYPSIDSMGKIINGKHFDRLNNLIDEKKVIYSKGVDKAKQKISCTLMDNVTWSDAVMKEEIFGPILPILTFSDINSCLDEIYDHPTPLALYFFSSDHRRIDSVERRIPFGGGCINDTIIHLATSSMPFGGMKQSGMGQYHGKYGFETFSHYKSIVNKKTWIDLPMRYAPITKTKDIMIRMFLK